MPYLHLCYPVQAVSVSGTAYLPPKLEAACINVVFCNKYIALVGACSIHPYLAYSNLYTLIYTASAVASSSSRTYFATPLVCFYSHCVAYYGSQII